MIYAYQLWAKLDAGLVLAGQDEDGGLEWLGTFREWEYADRLEAEYSGV